MGGVAAVRARAGHLMGWPQHVCNLKHPAAAGLVIKICALARCGAWHARGARRQPLKGACRAGEDAGWTWPGMVCWEGKLEAVRCIHQKDSTYYACTQSCLAATWPPDAVPFPKQQQPTPALPPWQPRAAPLTRANASLAQHAQRHVHLCLHASRRRRCPAHHCTFHLQPDRGQVDMSCKRRPKRQGCCYCGTQQCRKRLECQGRECQPAHPSTGFRLDLHLWRRRRGWGGAALGDQIGKLQGNGRMGAGGELMPMGCADANALPAGLEAPPT